MTDSELTAQPIINVEGEQIALGPLRGDLIHLYTKWRNDFGVARTMDALPGPMTLEERQVWLNRSVGDVGVKRFTIYERSTWRPIGLSNLHDLDLLHGTAEIGIAIGEADARGKGYGTETVRLMLDYAFTAIGLHNVMLRVYEYNKAGLRAYQKAGFKEIGRRRQSRRFAGRRWDEIFMECLATDFESPVLSKVFAPDA